MKLARIALTPPISAISVFAFFALTLSTFGAVVDEFPDHFVEWLGATGSQQIDTGYVFKTDPRVETTMMLTSGGDKDIMGTSAANDSCFIIDYKDSVKTIYYRYHASGSTQVKYTDSIVNKWVDVSFGSSISYDGNKLYVTPTADFSDNTSSFYLFYARTGMDGLRFKRVKMYDGGVLVRDFWPAVMANGTACMYDTITKKCHTNNKAGTFSVGATVPGFKQSCAVTVSAQNCTVSGAESGTYEGGASITVSATPDDGAIFSCWKGAPKGQTTDNPLTMRIEGDLDLQAVCIKPSDHSAALSVDGYTGSTTLQGFPALVRISETKINGFSYSQCAADGRDLRFTSPDGATVYPHEIDTWNPDGVSTVWVRLPELKKGTAFKIHWGGAPAASTAAAVWGSAEGGSYVGVWHLNGDVGDDEPDSAKRDESVDLTATPESGLAAAMPAQMYSASSWTGRSRHLNASYANGGNYLKVPSLKSVFEGTTYSVSLWLNSVVVSGTTWNYLLANHTGASGSQGWSVKGIVTAKPQQQYWLYSDASNTGTGYFNVTKEWVHMVCTCDGKEQSIYVDGVLIKQATVGANGRIVDAPLLIGIEQEADGKPTFGGSYDELRFVGGAAMSADWVKAEYETVANELFITETKTVWTGTAGGRFEDGVNWSTGSAPAAGSPAVFEDDATYAVTFPEDFERANALSVTKAGGTTTFDTTGGAWTLPAAATYLNAQEHPIIFKTDGGNAFVVEQGETDTGVFKSENGVFSFAGGATPKTTFTSGLINFYDPDGTMPTVLNTVVPNADIDAETEFAGGTSRLPQIPIAPAAGRTVDALRFTGGTHDIFGLVSVANRMALGNEALVEVSGADTVVDMKGGYDGLGSGNGEGNYASFHSDVLRVTDGATLTVGGYRFRTFAADFLLEVLNGATLNVDSEYFSLGTIYDTATPEQGSCANYNTNRVVITDATVNFGADVKRAWFGSYDPWNNSKSYTTLVATDSEINSPVEIRLNAGVYTLTGCTGDVKSFVANSRHADLTIDGGAMNVTDSINMNSARQANITNSMTFKAGDHVVNQIIVSQNDQTSSSAGILNVEGGTLTVPTLLRLSGNGATSILNLSGGLVDVQGSFNILHYGGGSVKMNLTGGTLKVSAFDKTAATLAFYANGGAIEASTDTKDLVPNNASYDYRLGPNGLVIRTDYLNTTCSALFKDVEGEEGLLAKEGSGTLTLTATAFDFSAAEVRAGVLKFPAAATGVDFPATTVAGGTLDLSGSNGKPKFKSLTLGDGTVIGELKIDNASEFVLDDFTPVSAKITLSEPAVDGTYGAFKVKGDQTDKLELWEKTITDLPEGKQHVYTATYDEGADVTTFAITVEDKKAASGTAHWTGAMGDDWGTAGNWTDDAAVPTKETTVFFDSDFAPETVNIGGKAVAAGLDFSTYGSYTLGGSGALTLSDGVAGEIDVASGNHVINVPVAVKSTMPVTVAEDASLALNGPVTQDGLIKRGAGTLTLGAANDLRYGLRLEKGATVATVAGAFSEKPLTLGAAEFRYAGEDAATSEPLRLAVDPASESKVATIKTDADLTFAGGFTNTAGSIVKTGAGTLKFAFQWDSNLLHQNEEMSVTDGTLEFAIPSGSTTPGSYGSFVSSNGTVKVSGGGTLKARSGGVLLDPRTEGADARFVVDGSSVWVENLWLGRSGEACATAAAYLTNATVTIDNDIYFFGFTNISSRIVAKNSTVSGAIFYPQSGWFELDFDNSTLGGKRYLFNGNSSMDALFHNGGAYGLPCVEFTGSRTVANFGGLRIRFDNGRITAGANFKWIGEDNLIETRAGGLTIAAGENNVAFSQPVEGVGGVVKTGAGTLRFDRAAYTGFDNKSHDFASPVTLAYLGRTVVEGGTLAVTNGVVREGAEAFFAAGTTLDLQNGEVAFGKVAGSPTVVNGTLAAKLVVSNGDQMAFGTTAALAAGAVHIVYAYSAADLAARTEILPRIAFGANPPSGVRVTVDLGNGEKADDPLVLEPGESIAGVIATYTGADPDVSRWRVKGRGGIGVRGAITAANGEIRLTLTPGSGFSVLVR